MIYESIIFLHVLVILGTVYFCQPKARLDIFWMNQDVKYDFTADLSLVVYDIVI